MFHVVLLTVSGCFFPFLWLFVFCVNNCGNFLYHCPSNSLYRVKSVDFKVWLCDCVWGSLGRLISPPLSPGRPRFNKSNNYPNMLSLKFKYWLVGLAEMDKFVLFPKTLLLIGAYYYEPKFKFQPTSGTGWFSYKIWIKNSKTPWSISKKNLRPFQNYIQWEIHFLTLSNTDRNAPKKFRTLIIYHFIRKLP